MNSFFGDTSFDKKQIEDAICKKFEWSSAEEWTNVQFRTLKTEIEEATGNQISTQTLKQVFGKKFESISQDPQAFTKITLNRFVKLIQPEEDRVADPNEQYIPDKKTLNWAALIFLIVVAVLIALSAIFNG